MTKKILLLLMLLLGCKNQAVEDPEKIRLLLSHQNLGLAYLEENHLKEAKEEYNKIIKLAPEEALGYANLGVAELRFGQYSEAEKHVQQALQKSDDADIHLILAEIYDRSGRINQSIQQLESSLQKNPHHTRSHYKAAQLYSRSGEWVNVERHLARVAESEPGNLAARLQFIEVLIRNNKQEQARAQLVEIRRQIPELPPDATGYFETALDALRSGNTANALAPAIAVHNLLKPTPLYQVSIIELVGPGGAIIGFPIQHFSAAILAKLKNEKTRLASLRFVDITSATGLERIQNGAMIAAGDYNGDGHPDLFVAGANRLLKNLGSRFVDATAEAGLQGSGKGVWAQFADFDNDGKLDLYVVQQGPHVLYRNIGNGKFADVTRQVQIEEAGDARPLFVDLDNDGDLDLLLIKASGNRAYRNNGDGPFMEFSQQLGISASQGRNVVFGDYDEDGDLDLFIADEKRNYLYTNLRQGHFMDISSSVGLPVRGSVALTSADQNNDGFLDVVLAGRLFENKKDGTFQEKRIPLPIDFPSDTFFFDFDNDGSLDLLLVGMNKMELLRNEGAGSYKNVSFLMPQIAARSLTVSDYDSDGDQDLLVVDADGRLRVLRNDGGNANYWLNVRPVGLGPDSGKNNRNSIGAKIEIKTGDHYQMAVATEPLVHFGLRDRNKADVVRITWTNGVAQNHILPGSNQTVVEKQVLKGSCAFLYAWNGKDYEFVTDILWKSALGMPLGIMSGDITYGFPDSTQEYLKIPGNALTERNGAYSIQVTEELWETAYLDKSRLILLDHPNTVEVYVDEKFVTPPFPPLRIYPVYEKLFPVSATDEKGRDLLPLIREKDDRYVSNITPAKYQGIAQIHDLILDLGKFSPESDVVLFLNGWIMPSDASINVAAAQANIGIVRPYLQVPDSSGKWQTVIPNLSFPMGKNKMVIADLRGKFLTNDYRIRIRTNMELYWDQIFFTKNEPGVPLKMTELKPTSADLHYRGHSRVYRKSVDGPDWFDYTSVKQEQKWRDLTGYYTRYGDVTPLLAQSDDEYVILNSGDELSILYDTSQAPPLERRWTRDFLLYSDGWMKDGDLSTASGKSIDPLPFHGMSSYPYGEKESFPQDPAHREFLRKYNTRKVTTERFRKLP